MPDQEQPEWLRNLTNAEWSASDLAKLKAAADNFMYRLEASNALGSMLRGDLCKARETLAKLPVDQLQAVSVAAAALASLADEVAMEKKP